MDAMGNYVATTKDLLEKMVKKLSNNNADKCWKLWDFSKGLFWSQKKNSCLMWKLPVTKFVQVESFISGYPTHGHLEAIATTLVPKTFWSRIDGWWKDVQIIEYLRYRKLTLCQLQIKNPPP